MQVSTRLPKLQRPHQTVGVRRVKFKFQSEEPHLLGATVQNSLALTTWRTGFVHLYMFSLTMLRVMNIIQRRTLKSDSGRGLFQSILTTST